MLLTLACSALLAAVFTMLAFPRTPAARALHRQLVERPAGFLLDFTWQKMGRLLLLSILLPVLIIAGPEMLAMFALLGGDAAAIGLMIIVGATAISGGMAATWRLIRVGASRLGRVPARIFGRAARTRTPRKRVRRQRPSKDDSSTPDLAFA